MNFKLWVKVNSPSVTSRLPEQIYSDRVRCFVKRYLFLYIAPVMCVRKAASPCHILNWCISLFSVWFAVARPGLVYSRIASSMQCLIAPAVGLSLNLGLSVEPIIPDHNFTLEHLMKVYIVIEDMI